MNSGLAEFHPPLERGLFVQQQHASWFVNVAKLGAKNFIFEASFKSFASAAVQMSHAPELFLTRKHVEIDFCILFYFYF